jgi:hypothetical protein
MLESLPLWFKHDNSAYPRKGLGYRSAPDFIALHQLQ